MPVKSYIAYPHAGLKNDLEMCLRSLDHCEIFPSENRELIVVVSDTDDETQEQEFLKDLSEVESLDHYTLVAGFDDTH